MLDIGSDVSIGRTAVGVMDAAGRVIQERSVASAPEAVAATIEAAGTSRERAGLEAGLNSAFPARARRTVGLPAIVIDATHAAAALETGFAQQDRQGRCHRGHRPACRLGWARGVADLMRVDAFRPVRVRSTTARRDRALLTVRAQLRRRSLDARNAIWSIPRGEGRKPPKPTSPACSARVTRALEDEGLMPLRRPLVDVAEHLDRQVAGPGEAIAARAKASVACGRPMTVPARVGAHVGLTPRRFRCGATDWSGGISRAGDPGVRRALDQAANVRIHHRRGWCAPNSWAVRLAGRRGLGKAKVAPSRPLLRPRSAPRAGSSALRSMARKLAVVLHRIWTSGEDDRLRATARSSRAKSAAGDAAAGEVPPGRAGVSAFHCPYPIPSRHSRRARGEGCRRGNTDQRAGHVPRRHQSGDRVPQAVP